jgi:preprotein translocase subunit SecG
MQVFFPLGELSQYIFGSVLFLLSMFIIAVILLQRGKGGGLTGALGGLGGQSAFGVKAGDVFTRITAVAVLIWIFTCALACRWYRPEALDIEADAGSSMSIGGDAPGLGADLPSGDATSPLGNSATEPSVPGTTPAIESIPSTTVPSNSTEPAVPPPAVPPPAEQPPAVENPPSDGSPKENPPQENPSSEKQP